MSLTNLKNRINLSPKSGKTPVKEQLSLIYKPRYEKIIEDTILGRPKSREIPQTVKSIKNRKI